MVQREASTAFGADDEIRTRDPHLGKVMGHMRVGPYKPLNMRLRPVLLPLCPSDTGLSQRALPRRGLHFFARVMRTESTVLPEELIKAIRSLCDSAAHRSLPGITCA
jgi:hypothetical protein